MIRSRKSSGGDVNAWALYAQFVRLALGAPHIAVRYRTAGVEYLFAADLPMADRAARRLGWHPHGRAGWIKPNGNEVHFICFIEQLAIIGEM